MCLKSQKGREIVSSDYQIIHVNQNTEKNFAGEVGKQRVI